MTAHTPTPPPSGATPTEQATIESTPADQEARGRINKQCFLIQNIKDFMKLQATKKAVGYENFSCITGPPLDVTNELVSIKGIEAMFNLTAAQHAVLQPRLRFFIIKDGATIEMPFDASLSTASNKDNITIQDMVRTSNYRGYGAGIESFTYELAGTTPATSDRLITAKLKLYFKSIGDLFAERASVNKDGASTTFQYADLINYKKASVKSSKGPSSTAGAAGASPTSAEKNRYALKIVAGWGDPPIGHPLFGTSLRKAIMQAKATFSLQLIDHVIKYNQDGTLELDIEYMASIDYKFAGSSLDILWLPESEEITKLRTGYKRLYDSALQKKKVRQERIARAGRQAEETASKENLLDGRGRPESALNKQLRVYQAKKAAEEAEEASINDNLDQDLDTLEKEAKKIEELKKSRRTFTYRRIIEELTGPPGDPKKSKLYEIEVDSAEIGIAGTGPVAPVSRVAGGTARPSGSTSLTPAKKRPTFKLNKLEPLSEKVDKKGKIKIYYFFLGDLIDGVIRILKGKVRQDGQDHVNTEAIATLENTSILMGPAAITLGGLSKLLGNMADIPISFDLFQQWFTHHVYKANKDSYLLRDFIRDLMNNLVAPAFGQGCFNSIKQKATVGTIPLRVPRAASGEKRIQPFTRCKLDNIKGRGTAYLGQEAVTTSIREEDDYLYFFMNDNTFEQRRGDEKADTQNGVYHLRVGAEVGLVKSIEFKKTDIPFLRESRITNDAETKDGFLREKYDATIVMVGNTFFFPGQYIYIIPTVPGYVGMTGDYKQKLRTLGFGGYYLITKVDHTMTPNSYETELEARWIAFAQEKGSPHFYIQYISHISNCDLKRAAEEQTVYDLDERARKLDEELKKGATGNTTNTATPAVVGTAVNPALLSNFFKNFFGD